MLRLLYLSDIHFEEPGCLAPRTDTASNERKLLIEDLQTIVEDSDKRVDAILVTGDITFKAHIDEFKTATAWLKKIADINGIDESRIFVVPGNHDVDRNIADNDVLASVRERLDRKSEPGKKQEFLKSLQGDRTRELMLEPMQNYNNFAKQYDCDIELPDKPFWTHHIPINDKYKLCINGLTTTFFSNSNDNHRTLYLGEFQAYLDNEVGVVNLAMFHHPKDWLSDGDRLDDLLADNAQIWLSGHKHRQRYTTDNRYLDLPSAAVNPSEWEPGLSGYNIIDISVSESDDYASLELVVMMRNLQETPKQYVAKKTHEREDELRHSIKIPKVASSEQQAALVKVPTNNSNSKNEVNEACVEATQEYRNLTRRLWDLQASKRRNIISLLNIEVESDPLTDEERFIRQALEKIKKENLLDDFEKLIIDQEKV